ncbi:ATP-binding cassette domain-containing protein, partial [Gordonia otitidis]
MVTTEAATTSGLLGEHIDVELGGRLVVRDVTLAVSPGELVVLVGPNGCGKSTLLSVMAGLRTPQAGRVMVDGIDIAGMHARELARARSLVTQQNRPDTPFTVAEVVEMGRYPW